MAERDWRQPIVRRLGQPLVAARILLALACTLPLVGGCGGGAGGSVNGDIGGDGGELPGAGGGRPAPAAPNPVALEFRSVDLGTAAASDGRNYRTGEYTGHWGLDAISAEAAYQRGYFGQNVTIAVADDGMDPTHPDLAGRIRAPRHVISENADVFEPDYGGEAGEGHGTFVALVAAGARGNPGETFEIDVSGGDAIPTKNAHGVAPQASIMPIQLAGGGQPLQAVRHAVANQAHVLNFSIGTFESYYGEYAGRDGVWLTQPAPFFRPLLSLDLGDRSSPFTGEFADVAAALEGKDVVAVWAAGNDGWNGINNSLRMCGKNAIDEDGCLLGEGEVSAQDFMQNFSWLYDPDDPSRKVSFKDMWGDCGSDDCADYNSGSTWMVAPLFEPELSGKWLVVGALAKNGEIAKFSNGCGEARNWCLFAPGEDLSVGTDARGHLSGTSFAAPLVSGALAVLKSRLPSMPMEVVQAVLLASADPLGSRVNNPDEPDPVYGWGRLNLENAVTMQGAVRLPQSVAGTTRNVTLGDVRVRLSPALAQARDRLQDVEVAVGGVGRAYYNMNVPAAVETPGLPALGHAARDLLALAGGGVSATGVTSHGLFVEIGGDVPGVHAARMGRWWLHQDLCADCQRSAWREWSVLEPVGPDAAAPFFARSDGAVTLQMQGDGVRPFAALSGRQSTGAAWRQFGVQWRHEHGGFLSVAELSRIDESRSVWGTRFGALGGTRTETLQSRLLLSAPLVRNWRWLVGYEHASAQVSVSGGMLSDISGLRAAGWSAATRGRGVFRDDDTLRLSVRQATRVRGGQMRIDHVVATGSSFVDAFYQGRPQSLERQRTAIDLGVEPAMLYALGYSLPLGKGTQLASSLEYEGESRDLGVSAHLRMDF